jgi:hypothetical protein
LFPRLGLGAVAIREFNKMRNSLADFLSHKAFATPNTQEMVFRIRGFEKEMKVMLKLRTL